MTTIVLLIGLLVGGEPFRFEPRPETVPLPEPRDAESAGNAATDSLLPVDIDVQHAPADSRPICYVHSVKKLCKPCEDFAEWWLQNCDQFELNVIPVEYESFNALPQWVRERGVPLAHYESERQATGWASTTWNEKTILATWKAANPGRGLTAGAMYVGSPMLDQISKYLPNGTRISIDLPRPMNVSLDDKTTLKYTRIAGTLVTENGKSAMKLDRPLPEIAAWRGVWKIGTTFGAQINELIFWDTDPPSVGVGTNRGLYRFEMKEVSK